MTCSGLSSSPNIPSIPQDPAGDFGLIATTAAGNTAPGQPDIVILPSYYALQVMVCVCRSGMCRQLDVVSYVSHNSVNGWSHFLIFHTICVTSAPDQAQYGLASSSNSLGGMIPEGGPTRTATQCKTLSPMVRLLPLLSS